MFDVAIKNGTCGYHNPDHLDYVLTQIPSTNIPNKGDYIYIGDGQRYQITEVTRTYQMITENNEFSEWIRVYVIIV